MINVLFILGHGIGIVSLALTALMVVTNIVVYRYDKIIRVTPFDYVTIVLSVVYLVYLTGAFSYV